jgi:Domain of unknown function (DUF4112)
LAKPLSTGHDPARPRLDEAHLDAAYDRAGVVLRRLDRLARLLDTRFGIPGTRFRFGLDGLVGLIPGVGDALTNLIGLYVVIEAWRVGVPARLLVAMLVNIGIDFGLGAVPFLGDIFDLFFKSNTRNVDLLRRHLRDRPAAGSGRGSTR